MAFELTLPYVVTVAVAMAGYILADRHLIKKRERKWSPRETLIE